MPAESKAQQRFMGMVHATQKGEQKAPSKEVAAAAKSMKPSDAKDFASTKRKGLPEKKDEDTKTASVVLQPQAFNILKHAIAFAKQSQELSFINSKDAPRGSKMDTATIAATRKRDAALAARHKANLTTREPPRRVMATPPGRGAAWNYDARAAAQAAEPARAARAAGLSPMQMKLQQLLSKAHNLGIRGLTGAKRLGGQAVSAAKQHPIAALAAALGMGAAIPAAAYMMRDKDEDENKLACDDVTDANQNETDLEQEKPAPAPEPDTTVEETPAEQTLEDGKKAEDETTEDEMPTDTRAEKPAPDPEPDVETDQSPAEHVVQPEGEEAKEANWDELHPLDQCYLLGVGAICKQAGADPSVLLPAKLAAAVNQLFNAVAPAGVTMPPDLKGPNGPFAAGSLRGRGARGLQPLPGQQARQAPLRDRQRRAIDSWNRRASLPPFGSGGVVPLLQRAMGR